MKGNENMIYLTKKYITNIRRTNKIMKEELTTILFKFVKFIYKPHSYF